MKQKIPERLVTLGLIQMAMEDSMAANLERALKLIRSAQQKGAQVVCLPELFRTPYFANVAKPTQDWSEPVPGDVGPQLSTLAKELQIVIVGGSVYEKASDGKLYNTAMVYGPEGNLLGTYRKMHIPHDPGFFEQNYFAAGNLGYRVFETPFAKIAVLICYDQWFSEAARAVALMGADIVFYPTAIGTVDGIEQVEGSWSEAWENVQRGHAIANNMIVAAVNRVGKEAESTFWGGSFICDAFGKTLARGGQSEEVVLATVNLEHSKYVRESWRFFHNRRPESYDPLTRS